MIKLAQTFLHSLSKPVLALIFGLALCGSAFAGNASIGFSAHVPAHSKSQSLLDYPQTVVSFSAQAALPVQSLLTISSDLRVFDETGRRIANTTMAYVPTSDGRFVAQLVKLNDNASQTFIVCAGSKKNCMRFRVNRF